MNFSHLLEYRFEDFLVEAITSYLSGSLNSSDILGDLADGLYYLVGCLYKESILASLLRARKVSQSQMQWESLQ